MADGADTFEALVKKLQEEHGRQVAALTRDLEARRREVELLKCRRGSIDGARRKSVESGTSGISHHSHTLGSRFAESSQGAGAVALRLFVPNFSRMKMWGKSSKTTEEDNSARSSLCSQTEVEEPQHERPRPRPPEDDPPTLAQRSSVDSGLSLPSNAYGSSQTSKCADDNQEDTSLPSGFNLAAGNERCDDAIIYANVAEMGDLSHIRSKSGHPTRPFVRSESTGSGLGWQMPAIAESARSSMDVDEVLGLPGSLGVPDDPAVPSSWQPERSLTRARTSPMPSMPSPPCQQLNHTFRTSTPSAPAPAKRSILKRDSSASTLGVGLSVGQGRVQRSASVVSFSAIEEVVKLAARSRSPSSEGADDANEHEEEDEPGHLPACGSPKLRRTLSGRSLPKLAGMGRKKSFENGEGILKHDNDEDEDKDATRMTRSMSRMSGVSVSFCVEVEAAEDEKEADELFREQDEDRVTYLVRARWVPAETNSEAGVDSEAVMMRGHSTKRSSLAMGQRRLWQMGRVFRRSSVGHAAYNDGAGDPASSERSMRHPNSLPNFHLDIFGLVFLGMDFLLTPLALFDLSGTILRDFYRCSSWCFWLVDLSRNSVVGYYEDGALVLSAAQIARRYFCTWFLFDVSLLSVDTIMLLAHLSWYRGVLLCDVKRACRYIQFVRLLRGVKALRFLKMLEDRISSEIWSIAFYVAKLFSFVLVFNHCLACGWYAIGLEKAGQGLKANWVDAYVPGGFRSHIVDRYATAFHWALRQFSPAANEVQPTNMEERVFAILAQLFAVATMSMFISGITSAYVQLTSLKAHRTRVFWMLRRYLKEVKIPTSLFVKIQNHCQHAWIVDNKRVQEKNVTLLEYLSSTLRSELHLAIYEPTLTRHPLFYILFKKAPVPMQAICNAALSSSWRGPGDCLFAYAEEAASMFFRKSGRLMYTFHETETTEAVEDETSILEMVLWTKWMCRGTLEATTECEVVTVEAEVFGTLTQANASAAQEAATYARAYIRGLNRVDTRKLHDLFQTPLVEGLWFRVVNEFNFKVNVKRSSLSNGSWRHVQAQQAARPSWNPFRQTPGDDVNDMLD